MHSAEAGTAIAIGVAGWPLYRVVTSGALDFDTALVRGAVVVAACGYGVSLIVRLASRFETEIEADRLRQMDELYTDMETAVRQTGRTTEDGGPSTTADPGS